MENALDAGARRVEVTLKKAGSELIAVADDGCGMGPADARAAFGRHATSKIRQFEDLERLRTLGFRGEALASIASVAQVELRTRRLGDEAAACVRVDGGEVVSAGPCAGPSAPRSRSATCSTTCRRGGPSSRAPRPSSSTWSRRSSP